METHTPYEAELLFSSPLHGCTVNDESSLKTTERDSNSQRQTQSDRKRRHQPSLSRIFIANKQLKTLDRKHLTLIITVKKNKKKPWDAVLFCATRCVSACGLQYIYIVYYILSIYCVKAFSHLISVRGWTDKTQSQALKYQSQNKSKYTHTHTHIHTQVSIYTVYPWRDFPFTFITLNIN